MNVLEIKNLTKIYPNGVKALDQVTLTIKDGLFGLLGPNGAGKSTLIRTIATLQDPTSGSIIFNKKNIITHPNSIRTHLGYLPQEFGVYPKISTIQLLNHIAILKGISNKEQRIEQINTLLHQTNLYTHRKKSVYTFSGGMRQRFGIAQALLGNPKIIIVDEPTAGLDPEERNRFLNLLSEIGEQVIVILSTHILEDIKGLCSNMAILDQAKIITQGDPEKLKTDLADNLWLKTIPRDSLKEHQNNFNVISTRLISGKTQIQVLSESNPGSDFRSCPPDFESLYFSSLLKNKKKNG